VRWRVVRLVAHALHHGRRRTRAASRASRRPIQERPDLPRQAHGELVSGLADSRVDEEVEMRPQNGTLYYFRVEVIEEQGTYSPLRRPGQRQFGRHRHCGECQGSTLCAPDGSTPGVRLPLENQASLPSWATTPSTSPSDRRAESDARARQDRLRDRLRHQLPIVDVLDPNGKMTLWRGRISTGSIASRRARRPPNCWRPVARW